MMFLQEVDQAAQEPFYVNKNNKIKIKYIINFIGT